MYQEQDTIVSVGVLLVSTLLELTYSGYYKAQISGGSNIVTTD